MPVVIVGDEKNVAALRPRLFAGGVSKAAEREVTRVIAAANPDVNLKALEPGTVLTVPDSPHVAVEGDVSLDDPTKHMLAGVMHAGTSALDELVATAKDQENKAAAERKNVAGALKAKELDAAARRDKALGADLKKAEDAIAAEDALATERAAALEQAQSEWTAELDQLKTLLP